jgi:hypothetical protein
MGIHLAGGFHTAKYQDHYRNEYQNGGDCKDKILKEPGNRFSHPGWCWKGLAHE